MLTAPIPDAPAPAEDLITGNIATGNGPADVFWDETGTNVLFRGNTCVASQPGGLCG